MTSRLQRYDKYSLQFTDILEIQNFDAGQVKRFIHKWYLAEETRRESNRQNKKIQEIAERRAAGFLKWRQTVPVLNALTANPLLLTIIAIAYGVELAQGDRYKLYEEICNTMICSVQQDNVSDYVFSSKVKIKVIEKLAYHMMEKEIDKISREEAINFTKQALQEMGIKNVKDNSFLVILKESNGLLVEQKDEKVGFFNFTFQEFFTAACWSNNDITSELNLRYLVELVQKVWWHGTLKFYAESGYIKNIIKACFNKPTVLSLKLAFEYLEENIQKDNKDIKEFFEKIFKPVRKTSRKYRQYLIEVIMERQSKSFDFLDNKRQLSGSYVTCEQYQLFLDDMRKQGEYLQPDHWSSYLFPEGSFNKPVTGVRFNDAEKFCKWLTDKQDGKISYRLPTLQEAMTYIEKSEEVATWYGEGGRKGLFGLTETIEKKLSGRLNEVIGSIQLNEIKRNPYLTSILVYALVYICEIDIYHALNIIRTRFFTNTINVACKLAFERNIELARKHSLDLIITIALDLTSDMQNFNCILNDFDNKNYINVLKRVSSLNFMVNSFSPW